MSIEPEEYGDDEPVPETGQDNELTGSEANMKTKLQIHRELSGMKEHELPCWGDGRSSLNGNDR